MLLFYFVYLKALLVLTSEWAHLISNSQRFRFYGCSKVECMRYQKFNNSRLRLHFLKIHLFSTCGGKISGIAGPFYSRLGGVINLDEF